MRDNRNRPPSDNTPKPTRNIASPNDININIDEDDSGTDRRNEIMKKKNINPPNNRNEPSIAKNSDDPFVPRNPAKDPAINPRIAQNASK
mmetsp:Transcript_25643/g.25449  ORF Transcript_25643/g.25449 Transcript_25643/m.25449 type:complete len:90 (-) Transcript_25643:53-322(-)